MVDGIMLRWLDANVSWTAALLACVVLSLAPFPVGSPHLWEKLGMLWRGELVRIIDRFDLVFHGWPWGLLALKMVASVRGPSPE
jgi:hypothetical protein